MPYVSAVCCAHVSLDVKGEYCLLDPSLACTLLRLNGCLQEDAWEEEEEEDDAGAEEAGKEHVGPEKQKGKKTTTDRNRAARAREQDAALEAKQKVKQQRRDLQNVKALEQELAGGVLAHSSYSTRRMSIAEGIQDLF